MKRLFLLLAAVAISLGCLAQDPYKTVIPDIPGYKTLKCDFHIHTVFSDGRIMPETRVLEALKEGLDAIAMTDHIEYRPNHSKWGLNSDFNESYKQAKAAAKGHDILIVPGAEITRGMPPGHWNAIFLQDANKLEVDDWREAFREAKRQGAFIFWNHPGWVSQQPNEVVMYPEHHELYNEGIMMGIELTNHSCCEYAPGTHQWAEDMDLAIIGNTDIHHSIPLLVDFVRGEHRDMTLVFAEEKTEEALKEAVMAKRTAVYSGDKVIGKEKFLKPLLENMLEVSTFSYSKGNSIRLEVKNNSSVPVYMSKGGDNLHLRYPRYMVLRPYESRILTVSKVDPDAFSGDTITLNLVVENFLVGPDIPMEYSYTVELK